jgi:twinkle protein
MRTGEMMDRIVVTKEMIDELTGEHVEDITDYKVKSTGGYLDQLKKYYTEERSSGYSLPFGKLDGNFAVRKGELTIFTGISGSGKSMLLGQICLYLTKMTKVLVCSMEMKPVLTLSRMLCQRLGDPNPTEQYIEQFCQELEDKLFIYDQQGVTDSKDMFAVLHYAKLIGVDVITIDSLMKCSDISEDNYEAQKVFIDKLATYCRDLDIHVFLVCHTRKMSDDYQTPDATNIMGSSHIRNLSDNILLCFRDREVNERIFEGDEEAKTLPNAYLYVQKQRNHTWEGRLPLWFNEKSLTYREYYK